jgi:hypothetical protein
MYVFNPTKTELALLAMIRWRESGGNYGRAPKNPPYATAAGAYQFVVGTWKQAVAATGVGGEYASAHQAPAVIQDTNALWLLREFGANSRHAWAASGPYPSVNEVDYVMTAMG